MEIFNWAELGNSIEQNFYLFNQLVEVTSTSFVNALLKIGSRMLN